MKFCPNCGNELKSTNKFCPKCGKQVASDTLNNGGSFKNIKSIFINNPKLKYWLALSGIIVVAVFMFFKFSGNVATKSAFNLKSSTNVSFESQLKDGGKHIWLQVNNINGQGSGIAKNSIVRTVFSIENNKLRAYQIFDKNITLGELSKMSDSEVLNLAKKQDEKYATTGAIEEIKHRQSGKDGYVGLENDFNSDVILGYVPIYYVDKNVQGDNDIIKKEVVKILKNKDKNHVYDSSGSISLTDLKPETYNYKINKFTFDKTPFGNAVIKEIQNTKYQSPKLQKIQINSITDNSGNKVTQQDFSYTAIDMFNADQAQVNLYNYIKKHEQDFLRLLTLAKSLGYSEKDIEQLYAELDANSKDEEDIEKDKKYVQSVKQAQAEGEKLYNKLIKGKFSIFAKGTYGYNEWQKKVTLVAPMSQEIYKEKYIGYEMYNSGSFLVTRAQNSEQKAVLGESTK
ncbi:zinc-ribbon domain-containing protein [Ligilactobacillus murinus]|uniref:zinc ribbon domain-containing protein n=1 Tax=Ligilactobacillus murinus TaxID=1622 RepID=UPI00296B3F83|nr:zinc-ribbon domain-containing protein [Ligilactobacillus murinus]WOY89977.1 zinc-ribbon domain-containing protein [Ligilactobacillus murinus]